MHTRSDGGEAPVSFAREPLVRLGGFDEHARRASDVAAARALVATGLRAAVAEEVVVPPRHSANGARAGASWAGALRRALRDRRVVQEREQPGAPPGALL